MADIDVYVESRDWFEQVDFYTLGHILRDLEAAGLSYRICERLHRENPAPCAFMHVDLTELPAHLSDVEKAYERCINGRAKSISRLLYSQVRLDQGANHSGPVIVKSLLNHRGLPELRYARQRSLRARLSYRAGRLLFRRYEDRVCPQYEVYGSLAEVPPRVWRDKRRIVEEFLPGRIERPVVKHRYEFFIDIDFNTRAVFDSLLCDPATVMDFEEVSEVPDSIRELRRRLNLDFGSIDYFMRGDEAIAIDANKTVSLTDEWVRKYPEISRYKQRATERLIRYLRTG